MNFFGTFGYFVCLLQWFWGIILYFNYIESLALFITPSIESPVVKPVAVIETAPNIPLVILSVVITIIMVAVTIYVIIKIPSTIYKTSKKIVRSTAENITPIVLKIQHKKDTKKVHLRLTFRLIIFIKISLIIIPVILSFASQFMEKQPFDYYIVMYVGLWLAVFSTLLFAIQYILASLLSINRQDIW